MSEAYIHPVIYIDEDVEIGEWLDKQFKCPGCGKTYIQKDNSIKEKDSYGIS